MSPLSPWEGWGGWGWQNKLISQHAVSACRADIMRICTEGWQNVSAMLNLLRYNGKRTSPTRLCPVVILQLCLVQKRITPSPRLKDTANLRLKEICYCGYIFPSSLKCVLVLKYFGKTISVHWVDQRKPKCPTHYIFFHMYHNQKVIAFHTWNSEQWQLNNCLPMGEFLQQRGLPNRTIGSHNSEPWPWLYCWQGMNIPQESCFTVSCLTPLLFYHILLETCKIPRTNDYYTPTQQEPDPDKSKLAWCKKKKHLTCLLQYTGFRPGFSPGSAETWLFYHLFIWHNLQLSSLR